MKWRILIGPVVVLLGWSVVAMTNIIPSLFLPSPWQVLFALYSLAAHGPLWADLSATAYRTFTAFFLSAVLGLSIGLLLGGWQKLYESFEVVFDFFRSLPSPALIPLAMLLF